MDICVQRYKKKIMNNYVKKTLHPEFIKKYLQNKTFYSPDIESLSELGDFYYILELLPFHTIITFNTFLKFMHDLKNTKYVTLKNFYL